MIWNKHGDFTFTKPYVKEARWQVPPVIDGDLKEWNHVWPIDFNHQSIPDSSRAWGWIPASDAACSGRLYMMYDDTYFYFAAHVNDLTPGHFSDAGWAADAIEYYFANWDLGPDAMHGDLSTHMDDATTGQYSLQLNISFSARLDSMVVNKYGIDNVVIPWNRNDVKYMIWEAGDGYDMEGRIAWADIASPTTGNSAKFIPGRRVACTWSLFGMDDSESSANFCGYQYATPLAPPWMGPLGWGYVDVKSQAYCEIVQEPVGIKPISTSKPNTFTLSSAYPNPFNPSTNFQYSLNKAGNTSIRVYNVLGQLVKTVVNNQYHNVGTYRIDIDMSGLTSGVYITVLEQGNNRAAQKMVLLK